MNQYWTWNYSVANAIASVMLAGASQVALGMLDMWTYPDVRLARLRDTQDAQGR